ncbi:MAG: hypothetical protein A2175_02690 [Candidatus Nealsonbacteria bacterium RBG_13_42_11]|uniref:Uncharacterized protein n=1 Tax=Candidatus Nealsonbacteria bacterium RBG_13_42_11 TaxID=1801663 RepID=A0A1G2DYP5_9BACT|nr:MAG: hypothetical protein A2175_02690 [Candidatus Nealsonbacteria bacterium RBG_13_42_11]
MNNSKPRMGLRIISVGFVRTKTPDPPLAEPSGNSSNPSPAAILRQGYGNSIANKNRQSGDFLVK